MKRIVLTTVLVCCGLLLVGYRPRPYSDLAEYSRTPMDTRISRLQTAGEDFFLRRRYEEAVLVFETILSLDEGNLEAKLWVQKTRARQSREKNEALKKSLYEKHGQLIPKEMTYHNWTWGPTIGHFEVTYSEYKRREMPKREFRPRATDEQLAESVKKFEQSGDASDQYELSMNYWSRRETDKALKHYLEAIRKDPELLALDDEMMLVKVTEEVNEKVETGAATANDLMSAGQLGMLQGDRHRATSLLVRAAMKNPGLKAEILPSLIDYIDAPGSEIALPPPLIYGFRQAYMFDGKTDTVYVRISLSPRGKSQIVPVDMKIPFEALKSVSIESDAIFAVGAAGIDNDMRLWIVLPEKESDYPEYNVKLALNLDRDKLNFLELSNFALGEDRYIDNWSFVIGSEFNFSEDFNKGDFETNVGGLRVSSYDLNSSAGRGPAFSMQQFTEPPPRDVDVWKMIESGGQENF